MIWIISEHRLCGVFFISGKKTVGVHLNLVWNVFLANISLVLTEICCSEVHVYRLTAGAVECVCNHSLGIRAAEELVIMFSAL